MIAAPSGMGVVLRGLDGVEAHLVGRQAEVGARVVGISTIIVARTLDPVLSAQAPRREQALRRWVGVVHHQAQLVLPAACRAERVELVLANDMRSKAVRVE